MTGTPDGLDQLAEDESLSGFRLDRLEVYNWGTFDHRVWTFDPRGANALLTGDIGSGKSTIVDAITTLLLPANRITYNKAAGAETRERSLRSYVLGYYKSERSEATGSSRPVGLRDASSFSVILGIFTNRGYGSAVALAQVFWFRDLGSGQPDRFFATADTALSVATDFSDFGGDTATLRKRLRAGGARVYDHFPEYGRDFRRRLGIESDQAMDLFQQTVSMKSVGNLTEFVRSHMLEPFDAASWTDRLVAHFEDLTKAHDAVRRAQDQLTELQPLLKDCDTHDTLGEEIGSLTAQRASLRYYFAGRKVELLDRQTADLARTKASLEDRLTSVSGLIERLRDKQTRLELERAGHGGDRLSEIERRIADDNTLAEACLTRSNRYNHLLKEAGLRAVETAEQFADRKREVEEDAARTHLHTADLQNRLMEVGVEAKGLAAEAEEVNAELVSLRNRRSSIPKRSLDLRGWLCRELALPEAELPFAGELIQVRAEEAPWEGAAERLLRGFGLSLLVADAHYTAVSDWINDHHLGTRLVYYRVPTRLTHRGEAPPRATGELLVAKLEIKNTSFHPWLERELAERAGYECVETMAEFRRAHKAITRSGQVKSSGGRHEKNDVTRIDDRSSYVLGWSNQQKIDALVKQAQRIQTRTNELADDRTRLQQDLGKAQARGHNLAKLEEVRAWADLDWQSLVNRIADLEGEKKRIERSSRELERITHELAEATAQSRDAEKERSAIDNAIGGTNRDLAVAQASRDEVMSVLAEPGCEPARGWFDAIAQLVAGVALVAPADCDRCESTTNGALTSQLETKVKAQSQAANRAVSKMGEFRRKYPVETAELDDSVHSASEYRDLHRRLVEDDLPRFQARFKTYLNTNTIRDIAGFQSQLHKQVELIKERVDIINASLVDIDYNPGRYIRLEHQRTVNVEVRDFITQLRECTDSAISGDGSEQYSEQKFVQVSRIIERFRGRAGQTEADRAWTRRVTDVRNWFVFSASERWRETDTEHEHYTDSGGKSGGQKEKLAYTILAASLAYQFKLEWGAVRSKTFRFVVIDEAFGRGSDESTRFALALFRRLGLQLLIVTPLQKIHVIDPYVSAVGFVDNPNGAYSRVQTLTIEEYRERQLAHAMGRERDMSHGREAGKG